MTSCIRFAIFLFVILILTVVIVLCLYPPCEKIQLSNGGDINKDINVSEIIASKFSLRSLLADTLQIPLQLKWYDIYVKNNSKRFDQNCVKYGTGEPILGIYFNDASIPNRYASSSNFLSFSDYMKMPSDGMGKFFLVNDQGYLIEWGKTAKFIYKADEPLHYRIQSLGVERDIISRDGRCAQVIANMEEEMQHPFNHPEENPEIYAMPNLMAWCTKFAILFIILLSLGTMTLSLSDWARKK